MIKVIKLLCVLSTLTLITGCQFGEKGFVYGECIERVKSRLKSPSTAIFSSSSETSIKQKIKTFPNDGVFRAKWIVKGYVDSQNSFGAHIRSNFSCEFSQWKNEIKLTKVKV